MDQVGTAKGSSIDPSLEAYAVSLARRIQALRWATGCGALHDVLQLPDVAWAVGWGDGGARSDDQRSVCGSRPLSLVIGNGAKAGPRPAPKRSLLDRRSSSHAECTVSAVNRSWEAASDERQVTATAVLHPVGCERPSSVYSCHPDRLSEGVHRSFALGVEAKSRSGFVTAQGG